MSTKKAKLLESAQKNFLKGLYDKAISEYRQIIQLDPDIKHRQKLAEILSKANKNDDAIKEYSFLAKHYIDSVHYLKAIAVYKQIQKIDPTNPDTSLTLASLNEKQGLIGNAIAEYSSAIQIFESRKENLKALKALESMLALDPGNLAVRLRVAEKHFSMGSEEQSADEFVALACDLKERDDKNGFQHVSDKIRQIFKDKAAGLFARINKKEEPAACAVETPQATEQTESKQIPVAPPKPAVSMEPPVPPTSNIPESLKSAPPEAPKAVPVPPPEQTEPFEEIEELEDIDFLEEVDEVEVPVSVPGSSDWEEEIDLGSVIAPEEELPVEVPAEATDDVEFELEADIPGLLERAGLTPEPEEFELEPVSPSFLDSSEILPEPLPVEEFELEVESPSFQDTAELPPEPEEFELEPVSPSFLDDSEPSPEPLLEEEFELEAEVHSFQDAAELPSETVEEETETGLDEYELELLGEESGQPEDFHFSDEEPPEPIPAVDEEPIALAGEESVETFEEPPEPVEELDLHPDEELPLLLATGGEESFELDEVHGGELELDLHPDEEPDETIAAEDEESFEVSEEVSDNIRESDLFPEEPMPETTPSDVEETFESDDIRETDLFPEEQIPGAATLFSGDSFDLGKELSGFADEIDFDLPRTDKEDSGFNLESMTGFKKNELNNEDAESHYSLGLAYKEMGLFDEAIDEFIVASNSPERQIDCQVLQGVCLREKGEPAQAVEHLEEILDQPNLSETEILGIKYELAICHETTGYKKLAKQLFNEIIAISPNFSDTADRLSRL